MAGKKHKRDNTPLDEQTARAIYEYRVFEKAKASKVMAKFNVSRTTIYNVINRYNETGTFQPSPSTHPHMDGKDGEELMSIARENPNMTYRELGVELRQRIGKSWSIPTIGRHLQKVMEPRREPFTEDEKSMLYAIMEENPTLRQGEIVKELEKRIGKKVTTATAGKYGKQLGFRAQPKKRALGAEELSVLYSIKEENRKFTQREIVEELEKRTGKTISISTLWRYAKERGVPRCRNEDLGTEQVQELRHTIEEYPKIHGLETNAKEASLDTRWAWYT